VAGLLIRQYQPVPALALTAAGVFGHLAMQTKFQLLDLALPLALYTLAATARSRRRALGLLALTMTLTYAAMLVGRIGADAGLKEAAAAKQAQAEGSATRVALTPSLIPLDALVDTSASVLEMWLLSVAAFAVGDGV